MASKVLLLLGCLIVNASCGQRSLTFVIDETASMGDDINQVKAAASSIVEIVMNQNESQIEDIVLVTFNDPGTGVLKKKTRDAQELKNALRSIHVGGGGDCEELSLSGIKKGLEESRPGSYLYVFTDASAKDYYMYQEIKMLSQSKQIQIVFILTGNCGSTSAESIQVYNKIAAASNGQVFNIGKSEVAKVLEYVKETIKGERTIIASNIIPAHTWIDIKFNIDEQTQYAVVSASGENAIVKIFDVNSVELRGELVTSTRNVKVLKLTNISPGTYTARVKGNSPVHVMIFGRTDFSFQYGFSSNVETSLQATESHPTTDSSKHLMVFVQDGSHSVSVREVEIVNMMDQLLIKVPLTLVKGNVFKTEKLDLPQETFKIVVVATNTNGRIIRRAANTPITPVPSEPLEVFEDH